MQLPQLPKRSVECHKGDFGHALVMGGKRGMTGAAILASHAALRVGAGLVTIATPKNTQAIAAAACPVAMTLGLPWKQNVSRLRHKLFEGRHRTCVMAVGPGLGRRPNIDELVVELFLHWPNPMILDADALNVLADNPQSLKRIETSSRNDAPKPRVLTPHPGEWSRICGIPASQRDDQKAAANQFATQHGCIVVLKGSQTFITNGCTEYVNRTGNPSLAVGGSGDTLTGIITGLICQKMEPLDAAILGVHLHGLAADIAHAQLGSPSTLATDLLNHLPAAMKSCQP
ncbi:MAG: NAD(P)H-hydrate dehydratase [Pirellula sp.]|nr:NAD(P)H-hydrate dehydratase [Pirellula sp.]